MVPVFKSEKYVIRWFTQSVWYQTAVNARHFTPGTEECCK